ncbi:uncharacterized protein B0P05DRAFT_628851 [Gilbertella persicaria]|uniref:uncharacterized protein n=1 Tax=Gilbertella persicaria TaxID=101096 RepID=UPI00221F4AE2|nr:uncharacterized protein B0P05DRAFT_628851 [Gilbertella persicaria]KAI8050636.1 hypothetical protein B0P05DRAFT_628851 [Gilbertella persicaria]
MVRNGSLKIINFKRAKPFLVILGFGPGAVPGKGEPVFLIRLIIVCTVDLDRSTVELITF